MNDPTIDMIDEALAVLALIIKIRGEKGRVFVPLFERLEAEREKYSSIDERLERALVRAKGRPSRLRQGPSSNRRYNRISAV